MERKIQFLKANFGANFDAIGFFKEFKFMNKKDGESDLIDVVNAICSWKSDSDVKRWALEMKQNGFKDFRTEDTERYWTMVAEEASAFAQQKAFAAIRKSVYEDMENERAESPEKRRRSNNQEEPVRLYSPYRSPAHEQQYAVPFDTRITQKQKEKKRYNYLLGAGKRDVILQNDSVMWQINEENISRKLLKFRSACIAMVDKNQSLPSVTCEFALNCIFYMDANSAEEFDLDASTWNIIEKQLKTLYPVADVPTGIETILYSLAKTARNEYSACRRLITSWTEEESELAVMMVNNILQTYSPSATSSQEANEDSFITSVLRPALMPFLQETTYLKRAGCDGRVEGSRGRLVSRDRFADFSMAYTYGDIKQTLLITEVKPPKKCRNGHRPDLYKLGNEMKDTMDKIIKDGIHNEKIVCIGLLVEGYKCTVFVMDLLFHAMYRLFPVTTFHFPEDHYDLRRLVDAYEGLLTMRTLLLQTARACHHANIYATVLNDRLHYTVPSFDTPKRLKGEE